LLQFPNSGDQFRLPKPKAKGYLNAVGDFLRIGVHPNAARSPVLERLPQALARLLPDCVVPGLVIKRTGEPMTFNRNNFNRNNFNRNNLAFNRGFRDHRFHNRRDRFFFGVGFAGPWYDYGYNSCWVPTYWGGWQYICGYPYGGYGGYGGY
jgi:hypothetical protein